MGIYQDYELVASIRVHRARRFSTAYRNRMWEAYGRWPGFLTAALLTKAVWMNSGIPAKEILPRATLFVGKYGAVRYLRRPGLYFFAPMFVGLQLGAFLFGNPQEIRMLRRNKREIQNYERAHLYMKDV